MHNINGKAPVTLDTFGGLVTFASPDSMPAGASPRCHDVTFSVGSVKSRKGTRGVYSFAGSDVTNLGTAANSSTWNNPDNAFSTALFASSGGLDSGTIDITQFTFSTSDPLTGLILTLNAQSNVPADFLAQLIQGGVPIGDPKPFVAGSVSLGSGTDKWNANPNINDTTFGVRISATSAFSLGTYLINSVRLTIFTSANPSNFDYIKTFIASNGDIKTLAMDANGTLWVEDVTNNPGVLTELLTNLPKSAYAKSITADDREYIAFSDLWTGDDLPLQYNGDWTDKITQVGPGAPPVFTPQAFTGDAFPILTITQPAAQSRGFSYFLQSSGPGVTDSGNVATVYYSDSTLAGPDLDLQTAFNSGFPVYAYVSFVAGASGGVTQGPYVVQITSLGLASPPGQPRKFYYFTYNLPTIAATYYRGSDGAGNVANYQRSLATLTTSIPVPGLLPGNQITISASSVANYNTTWPISQDLNSGSVVITQSQVVSGTATFSYSLSAGTAPAAGQTITISGTTNANGMLNGANLTIITSSGGSSGTFTIAIAVPDAVAAAESGLGVTAGTIFAFDPGLPLLGSSTSPVYGDATGGTLTFSGTTNLLSPGTYQGTVFFGTRNSAETQPSSPVQFTIPSNTSAVIVSQVPVGPSDVTYRQISITEAGQEGQPGGNFYTIDDPVNYTVNGVAYVSNSFRINDNTTTSVVLQFRNSDLESARPIDQQGEDLFNQIEIGSPAWIVQYANRTFYGLTQSTITNFTNLSFDGGYTPNTVKQPLGWTLTAGSGGQLIDSPKFGNSYYISNTTGGTSDRGLISQTAYRDFYGVEILRPGISYSARVTARIPSGNTTGSLVIALNSGGQILSSYSIPFSSLTTALQTLSGALIETPNPVPADLTLSVEGADMADGADVEIDRIEIFPTRQPVNETLLLASYAADPEGVDSVTGRLNTNSENTQPCYGAVVMYDLLYLLKDRSMYYTQDSSGDEPDQWGVHEVSNKAGACGPNAYDSGEEWIITANRNGVYLFTGGEPKKISQEIQQVWDAINWGAGKSIWLRNDVTTRNVYIGIPLPTPNFWMPQAPANAAPVFPNVMLVMNYEGQSSGEAVVQADPVADTFYGDLLAEDLHRKWTLYTIASPYADFVTQQNGEDAPLLIGNGLANSKVYILDSTNDDSQMIPWRYCTYGFGNNKDTTKYPLLGSARKRWNYIKTTILGVGHALMTFFANKVDSSTRYSVQIALGDGSEDRENPLNICGQRVYTEFTSTAINDEFDLSAITMFGAKDTFNAIRGTE